VAGAVVTNVVRPGWPLIGLLAWGVLSFGAVYPWAYWPLLLGGAWLGIAGLLTDHAWRDPRLHRLLTALGAVALAAALQTVALPSWLVFDLSPGVDRFFREFRVGSHPAELRTLSIDPAATRLVLAEIVALSLLLDGTARLMRRWPLDWFVGQVMTLAVTVALFGIVQKALLAPDSRLIYGFWLPRQGGDIFGPFVNRNHFAGWMVMVVPLVASYGWALTREARSGVRGGWAPRLRWLGGVEGNRALLVITSVLIMLVALVMTGSRSGMAAGLIGMAVLLAFQWRGGSASARLAVTGLVAAVMLGATLWAGAGTVVTRFGRAASDVGGRLSVWHDTVRIASDFPVFGTGLGGYRRAMLVYQTHDREALYAQAHNDYLQLLAEGGLFVTLPAVVVVGLLLSAIVRRLRSGDEDPAVYWIRRGAVAGLVGMAAQSVVEFSLQMPGNAAMFVALTAIAIHRPRLSSHAYRV
jgi:O-antigen ligase